jgi:transcription elongation GreA/GreB family factor
MVDKAALLAELIAKLGADLEALEHAQRAAQEGATHAEAKPENDKDTRAVEQSYLARGQAVRVEALRTGLVALERMALRALGAEAPAALGALITVEEDGKTRKFFVAPEGGGVELLGGAVQVVTPKSPLGSALIGKRPGAELEVKTGRKTRALSVLEVA